MKRVVFLLASCVIYSDISNMVAKNIIYLLFDGSLKIPEGEKATISVEPSLADQIFIELTDQTHSFIS